MTFPTANSTIIRNEDGEPVGFETNYGFEPDYDPFPRDDFFYDEDGYGDEPDMWGDEKSCKEAGYHAESGNGVWGRDDVWQCTVCGSLYPREN